ncbi:MAG TPA: low molecular weight phosphatase family protein [Caulobacteraceae bacterium]|nr:low molecular weight phosphatase family protein [Caulobacteraceae bacterium]
MARAPSAVLFACGLNRIRSPMAAELARRMLGGRVFVDSVGLRVDPQALPDPFVAAVMDEVGIGMGGHEPKTFEDLEDDSFDLIVSLSPEAQHRAVEFARTRDVALEYWPTLDPSLASGSRDQVLTAYRGVRDALEARIRAHFPVERSFGG